MSLTRNQILIIAGGLLLVIGIVLAVVFGVRSDGKVGISGKVNFWGVFDSNSVINSIITDYKRLNPNVEVVYTRKNPATYEQDLINELAGARGPDLFMLHNTWLPKHFAKIRPLVESQISLQTFRSLFPTVIEQDFAPDGVVFGLPLYLDTLALFYNKDYFDAKSIALPPKTWEEFQSMIPRLVEISPSGQIIKAAAAMGGSDKSVNRATDILNLIMLQSGTQMVKNDFSEAEFASPQGVATLKFYTRFANPATAFYTWNDNLHYSIDNFSQGNTAMMFNYAYQAALLKEKNPFLRFEIAPMLQLAGATQPINFANYWGVAASIKSQNHSAALDFALYLTTNFDAQQKYFQLTGKPPAIRSFINSLLDDQDMGVFAKQALTARSWPQIDNVLVEQEFSAMIEAVITGQKTAEKAIQAAEEKVTDLMKRSR
ncbi:MAG: extracellular solute-binding protein [bacterium]|nr:extracellular solute-binding protein [bacterium]